VLGFSAFAVALLGGAVEARAGCCTLAAKRVSATRAEIVLTLDKPCYKGDFPAAGDIKVQRDQQPLSGLRWAIADTTDKRTYSATDGDAGGAHTYVVTAGRDTQCEGTASLAAAVASDVGRLRKDGQVGTEGDAPLEEESGCGCEVGAARGLAAGPAALILLALGAWGLRRRWRR
jgi:hypothetical protein